MTTERPEWLLQGDECGGDPVTLCLAGLPDLRTENPEIMQFLFDAHIGLAVRTGLDVFRLDTTKHISHEFWQAHRAEVNARLGEDFMLIGEVWDGDRFLAKPYFQNDELDAMFDFSFRDRVQKFLTGVYDAAKMGSYLAGRHDTIEGYHLAPFLSNYDMSMLVAMMKGDKALLALGATILMTIEGPPVLVNGDSLGRRGYKYEVLFSDSEVLVYARGDEAIVTINRSHETRPVTLDRPEDDRHLAFSTFEADTGGLATLPPRSGRVFLKRK